MPREVPPVPVLPVSCARFSASNTKWRDLQHQTGEETKMKRVLFLAAIACSATVIASAAQQSAPVAKSDPIATLVSQLDLERYKATIRGLTQFGDRRQGTARNRAAVDWIEAQLKSYGCATERVKYVYDPPPAAGGGRGRPNTGLAVGGGR